MVKHSPFDTQVYKSACAQQDCRDNTLVIGDFPPEAGKPAQICAELVYLLGTNGYSVNIAAFPGRSCAEVKLAFHTPVKFRKSARALERVCRKQVANTVIFLDSLTSSRSLSIGRFKRFKEQVRTLAFLASRVQASQKVTLICGQSGPIGPANRFRLVFSRIVAGLTRRPLNVYAQPVASTTVAKHLTKQNFSPVHPVRASHFCLQLAHGTTSPTLLPKRILNGRPATKDSDLLQLAELALDPVLFHHPAVRYLRRASKSSTGYYETPPPFPILEKLNTITEQEKAPLSAYMIHLRTALKLEEQFPLHDQKDTENLVNWYCTQAYFSLPHHWAPMPLELLQNPVSQTVLPDSADKHTGALVRSVIHFLENHTFPESANRAEIAFLLGPVNQGTAPRFSILMAMLCRFNPTSSCDKPELVFSQAEDWFSTVLVPLQPAFRSFSSRVSAGTIPRAEIQLLGLPHSDTGLGANIRMSKAAFSALHVPIRVLDTEDDLKPRPTIALPVRAPIRRNLVVHHTNADRIPIHMSAPQFSRRNDQVHVGFLLWELARIPTAHHLALDLLDEVWTPSSFVADAYRSITTTPVHCVGKAIAVPAELPDTARLSPNGQFTFLTCFDFHSSVERKNPLAAVKAFQLAFPKREFPALRLRVKTTPGPNDHWGDPNRQMARILEISAQDPRITVQQSMLPFTQLLALIKAADCIISTHRAEGFGYIPAFALALNKPVVCTDYGGTSDFCNEKTSFPIVPDLVPVPQNHHIFETPGALWADPDIRATATELLRVFSNPDQARKRAAAGYDLIKTSYSTAAQAQRYQARLAELGVI